MKCLLNVLTKLIQNNLHSVIYEKETVIKLETYKAVMKQWSTNIPYLLISKYYK